MEALGAVIWRTLRELGIEKPVKRAEALRVWPKVVGEKISQVTEPQFFSSGKIFIKVKNDAWRNELFFHKRELLRKLNEELGSAIVDDIVLK
jgi:predicted nucleic acid-binding Zn ribbon protein